MMPYFDRPPGARVLEEFRIRQDGPNRWILIELHGLGGSVFCSRKEAVCFALWRADGDRARVHVDPPCTPEPG